MTVLAKITLAAALLLSIAVPFGAFAAGEKTRGRYKTAIGVNVFLFMATIGVAAGLMFTGHAFAAEETAKAEAKPATDWEAKYNDLNDRYLRMAAEYDNFRKRSQREREQAYTDAVSRAVTALLPTYDNLERALKAETADTEYKKGVELTMTQLTESLKGINVTVIDAAAGTAFDPNFHNAVMHVEDENLGENVIAETFQQGFQIGDKVIRHAMVKVAN